MIRMKTKEGLKMAEAKKHLIPKNHLLRASLIWETWVQTCYNYERMMGQPCAHTFLPVVKDLYPDDMEKQIDLMTREAEFFNVHIEVGSCILGLAISMEEEKAMGVDIPNEFITNIKTSLMGPLAGVGDTIYQGVLIPILLALCIDITRAGSGNIWGSILYSVLMFVITYGFSYWNFMFGYNAGSDAIMDFLEKGILDKLLKLDIQSLDRLTLLSLGFNLGYATSYKKAGVHHEYACFDIRYELTPTRIKKIVRNVIEDPADNDFTEDEDAIGPASSAAL
jgi:mannose/fructose/N-acetylgalactosamine-specific phosphotransferase system component IID